VSYAKGRGRQIILNDINIQVREGEFVTVVGSSGCGKSTMLSLVLGSQSPTAGVVTVAGKQVERVDRDRGIVYQTYTLYKHLTVLENIALGLMLEHTTVLEKLSGFAAASGGEPGGQNPCAEQVRRFIQ
jgi:NitT/TauT family transport system ATP-binding protein